MPVQPSLLRMDYACEGDNAVEQDVSEKTNLDFGFRKSGLRENVHLPLWIVLEQFVWQL